MGFKKLFLLLLVSVFLNTPLSLAQEESLKEIIKRLEARIEALEEKQVEQDKVILHRQEGAPAFTEKGFVIGAGATIVLQGTNNTNATTQKKEDRADASYSADITIERELQDINGELFLHLEAGRGAGLEDELSLYSNVNRDADDDNNVRLTELWYEQGFSEDKMLLTFGKLDPTAYFDNNEVANDETTQFLGRIFRNSPTIEFPDNSAGVRLAFMPLEWLKLGYGIFDADSDWEKVGDNLFNIGEIVFQPQFFGREGNYRFLGWHNHSYHTKWLATEREKESAFGFGFSFDQRVTDNLTLFTRYGWQDPKAYNTGITATGGLNYSLEHSWSAGFKIEGKPWGREKDVFAFAVGQAIASDDYRKADPTRNAKSEGHLEAYYNLHLNGHLSVSPDFQYIWNPFGKDVADDTSGIVVFGLRTQIDF